MDIKKDAEGKLPMERVLYEVKKVIVGQDHLLERLVVALLARGHILVEGVPGLAKTMAIKTMAEAIGGEFKRIQFTPDLVPADLVGTRIYNQKSGEFNTSLGPVFTNLLLADEINRAPAKVQSALLEVMQEKQVTIGRETRLYHAFVTNAPITLDAKGNPLRDSGRDLALLKIQDGAYPVMSITDKGRRALAALDGPNGYPLVHHADYGKGRLFVLTVPDNFADLYALPAPPECLINWSAGPSVPPMFTTV